jgi:predicted Zn-ribbon and HTH transcriptional regulator
VDTLTPEQIAEMVKVTPTRLVHYRQCLSCGHEWKAPVATGRCPRCHGEHTMCETVAPCIEKRI